MLHFNKSSGDATVIDEKALIHPPLMSFYIELGITNPVWRFMQTLNVCCIFLNLPMTCGSPSLRGNWGGNVGTPHTPAKDCVLCTPAFPRKVGEPDLLQCLLFIIVPVLRSVDFCAQ